MQQLIRVIRLQGCQRQELVSGRPHGIPLVPQHLTDHRGDIGIIIDDENVTFGHCHRTS